MTLVVVVGMGALRWVVVMGVFLAEETGVFLVPMGWATMMDGWM